MSPQFQFSSVLLKSRDSWSDADLIDRSHPPGSVFLLGDWGAAGGLLKLTRQGYLILLSREQLFLGASFRWPGTQTMVQLKDGKLEYDRSS